MTARIDALKEQLRAVLGGGAILREGEALGELGVEVSPKDLVSVALALRDHPGLRFEQLIDLCGMDYSAWGEGADRADGPRGRFAVVLQLLSVEHNVRLRLRSFAESDDFPVLDSLTPVWPNADWYEREAFDLFGIVFSGHGDLRRILTDYGFVGHPFRKDFPLSGHVEMRYDPEQRRVVYQPVTIEPREIVPRVVREEHYADPGSRR